MNANTKVVITLQIAKPGVLPCQHNCCELLRQEILGPGTANRAVNLDRQEQPKMEKTHS